MVQSPQNVFGSWWRNLEFWNLKYQCRFFFSLSLYSVSCATNQGLLYVQGGMTWASCDHPMASCDAARCSTSCLEKGISGTKNNTSSAEISSRSRCLMSSQCDEKGAAAAATAGVALAATLLAVASSISFGWLVSQQTTMTDIAWW